MKRFKVTVTHTNEYEIEIDENIINSEWMQEFGKSLWPVDKLEDLAEYLANYQARFGSTSRMIEGFGHITRNGELPFSPVDYKDGELLPPEKRRQPEPGFNIVIVSEDENIENEIIPLP